MCVLSFYTNTKVSVYITSYGNVCTRGYTKKYTIGYVYIYVYAGVRVNINTKVTTKITTKVNVYVTSYVRAYTTIYVSVYITSYGDLTDTPAGRLDEEIPPVKVKLKDKVFLNNYSR